jgi:hypothetical protein
MGNIDITQVVKYENQILIWTLVGILVIMLLAFIRGIFRGWRYGTYRLGYFLILMIIGLACLGPIANAIGGINIAQWYPGPLNFSFDGTDYSVEVGTLFQTVQNAVDVVAKTADPNLDPASMQTFVLAFTTSLIKLIVIFAEGILLATVFNLLGLLLWHIAFKRIIPSAIRKTTYKKGRVWSSLEEFVGVTLVMAMMILPITSVINSIATGWKASEANLSDSKKESIKASDSTYKSISDVVDTYDNSAFAKVFFSWTKTSDGNSFDSNLMNFFTKCDYDNLSLSITSEIKTIADLGSTFVKTGVLSSQGTDAEKTMLIADSEFTPMLISALGSSKIVTSLLPFACAVATNMDTVKQYIGNDCGLDYSSYNWAGTLENLSKIVTDIQDSGMLGTFDENDSGGLSFDATKVSDLFTDTAKTEINDAFAKMSNDSTDFQVFNDLIKVAAANAALNADTSSTTLGIADFLPSVSGLSSTTDATTGKKIPSGSLDDLPADYKNFNLASQMGILYRSMQRLSTVDDSFIGLAINGVISNNFKMDELTKLVVNNINDVASIITGENDDGTFSNDEDGTSADDDCLLDSSLINNAMPKFISVMGNSLSTSLGGDIDMSDVEDALFGTDSNPKDSADRMVSIKNEIHSVLKVVEDFSSSAASKEFLLNLDTMPGITFDPTGSNITYISDDLLSAIAGSLEDLDQSLVMSTLIPSVFTTFLSGDNSPLASLGLGDITFDLSVSGLGTELSKLIYTYIDCQGLLNYIRGSGLTTSASTGFLKGLIPYLENETDAKTSKEIPNSSQLYSLLYGFAGNKILNPDKVVNGTTVSNSNFRSLITSVMKTVTGNNDYSYTGAIDAKTDSGALTDFLRAALTGDALDFLTSAMSGNVQMSSLSSVSFESLLAPLDDSELLSSCFGSMLDKQVLSLFNGADTTGVSFSNLDANNDAKTNWENEGKSLDTLIKAAGQIGDLSNIDFFGSDSVAIGNIIECLSSSKIFTDSDGTYHFGSFFFGVLKTSVGESNLSFIADPDGSLTKITAKFTKMTQADWSNESDVFANIIYSLQKLGGLDSFSGSSINWSNFTPERISSLLDALASSQSIGQNVTYKLYSTLISTLTGAGIDLGSNDPKLGNCNVSYIYNLFDVKTDAALTARQNELGKITDLVEAVTGSYGIVKSDGTLKTIDMTSASGEFFIKPVLNSLASSYVFNTSTAENANNTDAKVSSTAFECEMASIVSSSGIYGTGTSASASADDILGYVRAVEPIRSVSDANIASRLSSTSSWAQEVDAISSAVDDVKALGLNFSNLSITSLFKDSSNNNLTGAALESKRQDLENVLRDVNNSKVFFRALPNYINQGLTSMGTQLGDINISDANVYYNGKGTSAIKYDDDYLNGDSEIVTLTYIMVDGLTSASAFSSTNIAGLDADKTSELLSYMASSRVFNSRKSDAAPNSATLFQQIIVNMLSGTGDISTYYYNASSPKDIAQASSYANFNISSTPAAEQKARYYANLYFPDVVASGKTAANYRSTYCDSIFTSSAKGSFKSLLTFLSTNSTILTSFNSTSALSSIGSDKMETLLGNLNSNSLLKDIVPNLLATFLNSSDMNIDGVDASLASPYFAYWYNAGSVNLASEAKYDASYPDEEIETISSIFIDISKGQSTLNGAFTSSISTTSIESIKALLTDLSESYVFHKAGAWYGSASASTPTVTTSTPTADLTVFEQSMYLIYDKSSLASRATSSLYDSLTSNGRYNVTNGYKLKLHDKVKYVTSLEKEKTEIDNLTENDAKNSGLLYVIVSEGFAGSGLQLDSTSLNFSAINPTKMSSILKEVNKLYCISDLVPYEVKNLVGTTMGLSGYSSIDNTVSVTGATSYTSPSVSSGNLLSIKVSGGSGSYALSYSYDGTNYSTSTISLSDGALTSIDKLPLYYKITGLNSASTYSIVAKYDTSNFFLGEKEGAGIDALATFADSMYDSENGSYNSVSGASASSLGKMLSAIVTFLDTPNSFYLSRGYDASFKSVTSSASFYSRDITLRNALKFTDSGNTIDLGKYLGYDGSVISMTEAENLTSINSIFTSYASSGKTASDVGTIEGSWLKTGLATGATLQYAIEIIDGQTVSGHTIPAITMRMEALSTKSSGVYPLITMLSSTNVIVSSSTYTSQFGKGIANGLVSNLLSQQVAFGKVATASSHNILGVTGIPNDFTSRVSAVTTASSVANYGFSSFDFTTSTAQVALTNILDFNAVVSLVKKLSGTSFDSATAKTLLNARDATTGDTKLLYKFFYSGTEYDGLLNQGKFIDTSTPITLHTDYQNAFGTAGNYLNNVANQAFSFSAVANLC